jgi:hypothetical protein
LRDKANGSVEVNGAEMSRLSPDEVERMLAEA